MRPKFVQKVVDEAQTAANANDLELEVAARPIDDFSWFLSLETQRGGVDVEIGAHAPSMRLHTDHGVIEHASVETLLRLLGLR